MIRARGVPPRATSSAIVVRSTHAAATARRRGPSTVNRHASASAPSASRCDGVGFTFFGFGAGAPGGRLHRGGASDTRRARGVNCLSPGLAFGSDVAIGSVNLLHAHCGGDGNGPIVGGGHGWSGG